MNSAYCELDEDEEECYIENGQRDAYSIRCSFPKAEAVEIVLHYVEKDEKAGWLTWTKEPYWEGSRLGTVGELDTLTQFAP